LGKKGPKGGQLLLQQGTHRFYGDVGRADAGPAGDEQGVGTKSAYDFAHLGGDGNSIVGHDAVIHHLVALALGHACHPLTALVFLEAAGGGNRQDRDAQILRHVGFVGPCSHVQLP
jgi:hypothetical protein